MPFVKTLRQASFVDVAYWRVTSLLIEPQLKSARIHVSGWVNKEAYQADAEPLVSRVVTLNGSEYRDAIADSPALKAAIRDVRNAFETVALSKLPEFAGAVDDPDAAS